MRLITPPFVGSVTSPEYGKIAVDEKALLAPELLIPGEKPVGGVEINWDNSITNKLTGFWLFRPDIAGREANYVKRDFLYSGNIIDIPNPYVGSSDGIVFQFNGDADTCIQGPKRDTNHYFPATYIVSFKLDSASIFTGLIQTGFVTNSNNRWGIWYRGDQSNTIQAIATAPNTKSAISTTQCEVDKWYVAAGTFATSERRVYVNGMYEAINTDIVSPVMGDDSLQKFGNLTSVDFPFFGQMKYAMRFNRILTDSEVYSLYKNPYQFLRPIG